MAAETMTREQVEEYRKGMKKMYSLSLHREIDALCDLALTALRSQAEPVAWMCDIANDSYNDCTASAHEAEKWRKAGMSVVPLGRLAQVNDSARIIGGHAEVVSPDMTGIDAATSANSPALSPASDAAPPEARPEGQEIDRMGSSQSREVDALDRTEGLASPSRERPEANREDAGGSGPAPCDESLASAQREALERAAKVCDALAETILLDDMTFELSINERIRGHIILWNQQTHGYQRKEQLKVAATLIRALLPSAGRSE